MKKMIVGFVLGVVFASAVSYAAFTYKKVVMESWNGLVLPGQRIVVLDEKCTKVVVYPATSKIIDIKLDQNETLKVNMSIQK